jgi:hypothetical protein
VIFLVVLQPGAGLDLNNIPLVVPIQPLCRSIHGFQERIALIRRCPAILRFVPVDRLVWKRLLLYWLAFQLLLKGPKHSSPLVFTISNSWQLIFIQPFIHPSMLYSPLMGRGLFFSSIIFFTQAVGLLGRGISPSRGRYLYTGQHKHRINIHIDIRALSGI